MDLRLGVELGAAKRGYLWRIGEPGARISAWEIVTRVGQRRLNRTSGTLALSLRS